MNNHFGQILLGIGLVLFIIYAFRIRKLVFDRIIFLFGAVAGLILVFLPELSTKIANWLGIGRGVDFIFYLFIIISLFYFVSVSAELRAMRKKVTELTRLYALQNPQIGSVKISHKSPTQKKGK